MKKSKSRVIRWLVGIGAVIVSARMFKSKQKTAASDDVVDEWGKESFPASDPPSHW